MQLGCGWVIGRKIWHESHKKPLIFGRNAAVSCRCSIKHQDWHRRGSWAHRNASSWGLAPCLNWSASILTGCQGNLEIGIHAESANLHLHMRAESAGIDRDFSPFGYTGDDELQWIWGRQHTHPMLDAKNWRNRRWRKMSLKISLSVWINNSSSTGAYFVCAPESLRNGRNGEVLSRVADDQGFLMVAQLGSWDLWSTYSYDGYPPAMHPYEALMGNNLK